MDSAATPEPVAQEARRHHASGPYTITSALIAINVMIFILMLAKGVPLMNPSPQELIPWGADYAPATIGAHQWWRLLTSCFLHFGIIHIGMNMYVLFQIGPFIEIVFGRLRYSVIYILAGLGGSLVSLSIHPLGVGAGASGAIFGLYGAVFGFLLLRRRSLNPQAVKSITQSCGIFLVYNLIYGVGSRTTDLSAHIGGLITGFLFGLLLVPAKPWKFS